MSYQLVDQAFDLDLSRSERNVLASLARHAHGDGTEARPGIETIMRESGFSERTVQYALRSAESKGLIREANPTSDPPVTYTRRTKNGIQTLSYPRSKSGGRKKCVNYILQLDRWKDFKKEKGATIAAKGATSDSGSTLKGATSDSERVQPLHPNLSYESVSKNQSVHQSVPQTGLTDGLEFSNPEPTDTDESVDAIADYFTTQIPDTAGVDFGLTKATRPKIDQLIKQDGFQSVLQYLDAFGTQGNKWRDDGDGVHVKNPSVLFLSKIESLRSIVRGEQAKIAARREAGRKPKPKGELPQQTHVGASDETPQQENGNTPADACHKYGAGAYPAKRTPFEAAIQGIPSYVVLYPKDRAAIKKILDENPQYDADAVREAIFLIDDDLIGSDQYKQNRGGEIIAANLDRRLPEGQRESEYKKNLPARMERERQQMQMEVAWDLAILEDKDRTDAALEAVDADLFGPSEETTSAAIA